MSMHDDIEKVLVSEEQLKDKVAELGAQISRDYAGKNLVLVSILKGSVVFMADLMRAVTIPCSIDFMVVSSKDVLIVEDILDTGVTLSNLVPMLKMRHPNSVKICTILDKPSRRKADIAPDYEGFQVPDEFVVGYGLDFDEKYRNLPYIGALRLREIIELELIFFATETTSFEPAGAGAGSGRGADDLVGAGHRRVFQRCHHELFHGGALF